MMKPLIIQLINHIPSGMVCSYGTIAAEINRRTGSTISGWIVGRILTSMPAHERNLCPRHRVINKQGYISSLKLGEKGIKQLMLLRSEGVHVSDDGHVPMEVYEVMTVEYKSGKER